WALWSSPTRPRRRHRPRRIGRELRLLHCGDRDGGLDAASIPSWGCELTSDDRDRICGNELGSKEPSEYRHQRNWSRPACWWCYRDNPRLDCIELGLDAVW